MSNYGDKFKSFNNQQERHSAIISNITVTIPHLLDVLSVPLFEILVGLYRKILQSVKDGCSTMPQKAVLLTLADKSLHQRPHGQLRFTWSIKLWPVAVAVYQVMSSHLVVYF